MLKRPLWTIIWGFLGSIFVWTKTEAQTWTHHVLLDENFDLFWIPLDEEILFKVEVKTLGYVALGFSLSGGMRGSDMIIGWVQNSKVQIQDCFAYNNSIPVIDSSQDYKLIEGSETDEKTTIVFSRPWDTCDQEQDVSLGSDTARVIWSYSSDDPINGFITYHGHTKRGVRSLFLKEAPRLEIPLADQANLKIWDLRGRNTRLPNDDHTHYWCQIFKAPHLDRKHHMIGFEPIIQAGHDSYLHHMVLYECHVGENDSSSEWFEHHVEASGTACYSPNMPPEWSFCLATNAWAWAVGSTGEILPEYVGMPLGEDFGGATYFMLETHYNNPGLHKDLVDTSGIRIFYTDRLRTHDTSMLLVGSEVNFLHMIPPGQNSFKTVGRCSAECTEKGLDQDGIYILNGLLHSHLAGRQMRLRHFRNGIELPTILEDNNYDFNFQASRQPVSKTQVLPGDELMMECQYQTTNRSKPTFGGLSTRDEMCLGFILYYPRSKLADCRSLPALNTVMNAIGIKDIYGQAFQKLVDFMKDIDGGSTNGKKGSDTLQELLVVLASETGLEIPQFTMTSQQPLTEEDILNRPFYSVVDTEETSKPNLLDTSSHFLMTETNYRTLLSDLLLSVRIKSPESLHNQTIGEHVLKMDWTSGQISKNVEDTMILGNHSCLCLAHGRRPIIPYEEKQYPKIDLIYAPNSTEICQKTKQFKSKKLVRTNGYGNTRQIVQESKGSKPQIAVYLVFLILLISSNRSVL